jgi:IS4 transposase
VIHFNTPCVEQWFDVESIFNCFTEGWFMFHAEVYERVVKKYPAAVMVRAVIEQALPPSFVDEVFEQVASAQYTRKLLFSTLVRLLSLVVCRARSSVHACIQAMTGELAVNAKSVYNKLNGAEPAVAEALVGESAERMAAVIDELDAPLPPVVPGWKTRILDGNHLARTEHRLEPLRTIGGGPLPGVALVVYDAERGLVDRTYLCEDGHTQERKLVIELLGEMEPGELWIADRNFATAVFMLQTHANDSRFLVRRHQANGCIRELGPWRAAGSGESGAIDERDAEVQGEDGTSLAVRLIRVRLEQKTRDGDREIELVTDLTAAEASAETIASAYRQRWRIETAFAELDRVFEGEIATLGHPRAALLAFSLALIAFNTLSVVKAALRKTYGTEKIQNELSLFHLGENVQRAEAALEVFADESDWSERFATLTPRALADDLLLLASRVDLRKLRKHRRGAKKPAPKRRFSKNRPHVSTARVLAADKKKKQTARRSTKSRG